MNKPLTQEEYLNRMSDGTLISNEPSIRLDNAFYVEGVLGEKKVCTTIEKRNYFKFNKLFTNQNTPPLNQGEQK